MVLRRVLLKRLRRDLAIIGLALCLGLSIASYSIPDVRAYSWDPSKKVTFAEYSNSNPSLVYDSYLGRTFLAWQGTDGQLNIKSSSDLVNWSPKVTIAINTLWFVDLTYDSSNQKLYYAFQTRNYNGQTGHADYCLCAISSQDGSTWSTSFKIDSYTTDYYPPDDLNGASIAYNPDANILVASWGHAPNRIIGRTFGPILVSSSSDGGSTWSSPTAVNYNGQQVIPSTTPLIRYFNGKYFFTYTSGSANEIAILQSPDLSSWTISHPYNPGNNYIQESSVTPSIAYSPAEGVYHLIWSIDAQSWVINDVTSSDGTNWGRLPTLFEASMGTSVAYISSTRILALAWIGTDNAHSLNVEWETKPATLKANNETGTVATGTGYPAGITIYTSDGLNGVVFSFTTNFGSLSSSTCTTTSGYVLPGACSVSLNSGIDGTATVTATSSSYQTSQVIVYFVSGGGGGGGGGSCGALRCNS